MEDTRTRVSTLGDSRCLKRSKKREAPEDKSLSLGETSFVMCLSVVGTEIERKQRKKENRMGPWDLDVGDGVRTYLHKCSS